eukprot:COSAG02_NODE_28222_length_593_cov_1.629555_1_plen_36_part_01
MSALNRLVQFTTWRAALRLPANWTTLIKGEAGTTIA